MLQETQVQWHSNKNTAGRRKGGAQESDLCDLMTEREHTRWGHSTCKGPGVGRARLACERGQEGGRRRKMPCDTGVEAFA